MAIKVKRMPITEAGPEEQLAAEGELVHDKDLFKKGERVIVLYKISSPVRRLGSIWVPVMDKTIGFSGTVRGSGSEGIEVKIDTGETWFYPSCALIREGQPVHSSRGFNKGDRVTIVAKISAARGWAAEWVPEMDSTVGKVGTVESLNGDGINVRVPGELNAWNYPSFALRLEGGNKVTEMIQSSQTKPAEIVGKLKKKRVRVGKGPWDAAPCTHLRWHLMGFFREKLALVKTKLTVKVGVTTEGKDVTQDVDVTSINVRCTKCGTEMTLQAK
jgi:hypothetical protein